MTFTELLTRAFPVLFGMAIGMLWVWFTERFCSVRREVLFSYCYAVFMIVFTLFIVSKS